MASCQYVGQPMFVVVAETNDIAARAARLAQGRLRRAPAVLTPQQAKRQKSYVLPPMHLQRGDARAAMERAPRRLAGQFYVGGQEQFYLEGQISYAIPKEDGCITSICSTQHPTEMQHVVAHALELVANQVTSRCGGWAAASAARNRSRRCSRAWPPSRAQHTRRPVKIRVDRDDDFMITGKRHCFHYEYEVGYDDDGVIRAAQSRDGGARRLLRRSCRAGLHARGVPLRQRVLPAGRGHPGDRRQDQHAVEHRLSRLRRAAGRARDRVHHRQHRARAGRDPLDVRKANFYGKTERNVTPYSMTVEDNVIPELVAELESSSDYRRRRRPSKRSTRRAPCSGKASR
jgi:xanthine dehydrogenase large subunit